MEEGVFNFGTEWFEDRERGWKLRCSCSGASGVAQGGQGGGRRGLRKAWAGKGLILGQKGGWQGQVLWGLQGNTGLVPEGRCDLQGGILGRAVGVGGSPPGRS